MIIDFRRKPHARGSAAAAAHRLTIDDISTAVDPAELAAIEAADDIKLARHEERRQARARGERPAPIRGKTEAGFAFVRFSDDWIDRLPGGLWKLAAILQRKADFEARFEVTNAMLAKAGIDRRNKRRYLDRLERLGLIDVEWPGSQAEPWVVLKLREGPR